MSRLLSCDDFVADKLAWHQIIVRCPVISPSAKGLAGLILHDLNPLEGGSWRGQESMAASLGFTTRHLRRLLNELETAGFLEIEHRKGRTRTNICRATFPTDHSGAEENRTCMSSESLGKRTSASDQREKKRTSQPEKPDMDVRQSLYEPFKKKPPRRGGDRTPGKAMPFDHADTREVVVRIAGEDAAFSYLDQARWDPDRQRIVCTSSIGFKRLRELAGRQLEAKGVEIAFKREHRQLAA